MEDVMDEMAEELVNKCPAKVFDIEDIGEGNSVFVFALLVLTRSYFFGFLLIRGFGCSVPR
jgi:hypothetical protein